MLLVFAGIVVVAMVLAEITNGYPSAPLRVDLQPTYPAGCAWTAFIVFALIIGFCFLFG